MMFIDKFRVHKFLFYGLSTIVALRSLFRKKAGACGNFPFDKMMCKKRVKFVKNEALNMSFRLSLKGQGINASVVRGNKQLLLDYPSSTGHTSELPASGNLGSSRMLSFMHR